MFTDFLLPDYGNDESEIEMVNTNQFMLYYDDADFKEFKELCKAGMRSEFPENFQKANASDLLLALLRKQYGSKK